MAFYLIFTFLLSFLLIRLIIIFSKKLHLIDIPNERSTHDNNIPLGAGIGFIFALLIGLSIYNFPLIYENWYIFCSLIIVLCIGILDDVYHANPKMKIYTISFAVILLWSNNISIHSLGIYMGNEVNLYWVTLPFTLFALVAFTNALNLIDGIDGLAGLSSLIIISSFAYVGYQHHDTLIQSISFFTVVSLLPFIVLNYHPAKIFMGDSGSLSLGLLISILAMLSLQYIHPISVLFLTALPIYDTLNVVIRRLRKGNPIFQPDTTHTHHILLRFIGDKDKNGQIINGNKRTVWILVLLQSTFSSIGLIIEKYIQPENNMALFSLIGFIATFIVIYTLFTKIQILGES